MGSAKGPGFIGMLLALLVLVGFGTLYTFAFDSGGNKKSIESVIRDNDSKITGYLARVEAGRSELDTAPALQKIASDLSADQIKSKLLTDRVKQRQSEVESLTAEIEESISVWEDYKNEYRAFARAEAEGEKMPELKALDGKVYKDVELRKITAIGIEIRHKGGFKRIPFADLPMEMQDEFQFSEEQMIAEAKRELAVRKTHNQQVNAAQSAAAAQASKNRALKAEQTRERNIEMIAKGKSRYKQVEAEIRQIQSKIAGEERAAASARAAGRMRVGKAGLFQGDLAKKRAELANIQREINRLQSSL